MIRENARVRQAVAALRAGDMVLMGSLLLEAHASARDDYEISTPEIEALVRLTRRAPGVMGARLTGAGWGGCIVALVRAENAARLGDHIRDAYQAETGREARSFVCHSATGAGPAYGTTL